MPHTSNSKRSRETVVVIPQSYKDLVPFLIDTATGQVSRGSAPEPVDRLTADEFVATYRAIPDNDPRKKASPREVFRSVYPHYRVVFDPKYLDSAASKLLGLSRRGVQRSYLPGGSTNYDGRIPTSIRAGMKFEPYKAHYILSQCFDVNDETVFESIAKAMLNSPDFVLSDEDFEFCADHLDINVKLRTNWITQVEAQLIELVTVDFDFLFTNSSRDDEEVRHALEAMIRETNVLLDGLQGEGLQKFEEGIFAALKIIKDSPHVSPSGRAKTDLKFRIIGGLNIDFTDEQLTELGMNDPANVSSTRRSHLRVGRASTPTVVEPVGTSIQV
ncbi:MAG TPA: hypothetical protein PKB15_04050 [Acidimicrobiia bacterium]|nr:hypothetical protein [Acidimicrobiia bacterium]